ncbi:MAG: hypothetical protein WBL23_01505 [Salinisphaera sp.]
MTRRVEPPEHPRIVQLAVVGLVPLGDDRDPDMADAILTGPERRPDIAAHDRGMMDIHPNHHLRRAEFMQDRMR